MAQSRGALTSLERGLGRRDVARASEEAHVGDRVHPAEARDVAQT